MLLLLAWLAFVARRAVRCGDVGAGWGRSRGFGLLNLWAPYAASLAGRAVGAGAEVGALGRLAGSCAPRDGSLDRERMTEGMTSLPGERSNLSARALTLFVLDAGGGERDESTEDAGPDTDRGLARGGERRWEPAVFWRWRVRLMSGGGMGIGSAACSWSGAGV